MPERILKPGQILSGSLFHEPMRVETTRTTGPDLWVVGLVGIQSKRFRSMTLTPLDLAKRTQILPGLRQVHWDPVIVDEAHRLS